MAKLAELFETEIPAGRSQLQESHTSLLKVASFCEENYLQAENKTAALAETKQYATQSLASVAYQINTLATSMLQMLDLQGVQLADMESSTNHLARNVSVHKEKVSRREIGVLTANKHCPHTHKIVAPANPEQPIKYKSAPIDYGLLDDIGHGMKISDPAKADTFRKRKESQSLPSPGPVPDNFPVFNPDERPPNSPLEVDLYATVRKTGTPQGSPKSVRQYRSQKSVPVGGHPSPPPPPPPDPDMPPPPHPMPPAPDSSLPPAMAPPPMAPPPPALLATKVADDEKKKQEKDVTPRMVNPPPPPPDMMVLPPDEAASSFPPPPPMDDIPYPANMGIGDDEMPLPPEFVQTSDVDQSAPADYIEKVIALYGYEKNLEDELTFQEDDIIYVLKKNPNGWFEGVLNGVTGLFPGNYVQAVP
ncbi:abl interactor 2-like [Patiria miniata]|uniref:SH3 domain-containing protein n=1 Tax=Patiria miniata TaxID=46514 RepID=A0A914BIT2_PATMI|nr:abl interactor 2-like [Patiria miniata]